MTYSKGSKLLIASAIILIVLLFFAPKSSWSDSEKETERVKPVSNVQLSAEQKKELDNLNAVLEKANNSKEKLDVLNKLSAFWKTLKSPVDVARTLESMAEVNNTADAWITAGEEYYRATQFVEDNTQALVYQNAIAMFDKALKLDTANEKAKIKKGVCIVELGTAPMDGIKLLREVAEKNPKNIEAQLNLGFFSIRSNQYDKALERFENILKIDTNYSDAYIYSANTYEMMGDTVKAVLNYEHYIKTSKDTMGVSQVKDYIKKFSKN